MKDSFIVFGEPDIHEDECQEVLDTLRSGWIGTGPKTHRFEHLFAQYLGVPEAAAVNSATAGLHLACLALDLKPGDEVITTAMTFCATVNAILHAGATPVLADIDPNTWNMDPNDVARKITSRTKAILPVHLAGRCCDMQAIGDLAEAHSLYVIEDCAHAIETQVNNLHAGTLGDLGVFSFYVTKNVTTCEGGMVTAKDPERLKKIKTMALHGLSAHAWQRYSDRGFKHYLVQELGFKYNMTDLQASIGMHQLKRVQRNWSRRKEIWERYQNEFTQLAQVPSPVAHNQKHAYHLFQLVLPESQETTRDQFLDHLHRSGIGSGVHYLCLAEHPYYQKALGWHPSQTPNATQVGRRTISLPLSAKLSDRQVNRIVDTVRKLLVALQSR
ncbi:MAG: DegT/DnrJ/EryC1/StrS aminotransferase family protein [Acidobacteria bacterium]|nr:DegT/DnrJ/EryC1/StrS aminotransferase family protein [Acidobacteriota bacterium]